MNEDEREETRAETKSAKPTSNSRHADTERSPRPFHACAHPSVPVLSAFHSAQLHPADTLSPLSSPAPPLSPRRPLLVAPTPPPLRLITTLIHHHRGDLFSLFSFFVPILFLYPRISFSFPLLLSFILSFLSSRKERKLSSLFHLLLSLSRTFQHILFSLLLFFSLILSPISKDRFNVHDTATRVNEWNISFENRTAPCVQRRSAPTQHIEVTTNVTLFVALFRKTGK